MGARDVKRSANVKKCFFAAIHALLPKLTTHDVADYRTAIMRANYTLKRRKDLIEKRQNVGHYQKKIGRIKNFLKPEGAQWKRDHLGRGYCPSDPRGINAQSEYVTALLMPYCQAMDHALFLLPWFQKHKPVKELATRIKEMLGNEPVLATDFSSFEAHHFGVYAEVLFEWFRHSLSGVAPPAILALVRKMTMGVNDIYGRYFHAKCQQRMMSGVLWTSSGNGLMNLLIMSYLSIAQPGTDVDPKTYVDFIRTKFRGVIEGDDGLVVLPKVDYASVIKEMGLSLKPVVHASCHGAGFCGVVQDSLGGTSIRDPIPAIMRFGYKPPKLSGCGRNKELAYLRSLALAGKVTSGNSPIFGEFCDRVLEETRSIDPGLCASFFNLHERGVIGEARKERVWMQRAEVTEASRDLCEKVFGICRADQLRLEKTIRNSPAGIILFPLATYMPPDEADYRLSHLVPNKHSVHTIDSICPKLQRYMSGWNLKLKDDVIFDEAALDANAGVKGVYFPQ